MMAYVLRSGVVSSALLATLVVCAHPSARAEQTKPAADSSVNVTVKYTGKGTVDAKHRLWVWLFDTPKIDVGAIPIAEMSIDKNGGTAAFTSVGAAQVYVAIAYDEGGGFQGQAPPPPGSPIALYGAKGPDDPPMAVTPGPKGKVNVVLTDAQRFK
jgi:hypothetical protein